MICEHDRLARSCRECANIDDLAELESAHRMIAARNERLQKENDELEREVERWKELYRGEIVFQRDLKTALAKQNAELAEALRFYADREKYLYTNLKLPKICGDAGKTAITVLRNYGLEDEE